MIPSKFIKLSQKHPKILFSLLRKKCHKLSKNDNNYLPLHKSNGWKGAHEYSYTSIWTLFKFYRFLHKLIVPKSTIDSNSFVPQSCFQIFCIKKEIFWVFYPLNWSLFRWKISYVVLFDDYFCEKQKLSKEHFQVWNFMCRDGSKKQNLCQSKKHFL